MSRRANVKSAGIQLFPFLAVLICTMGALVVLLHAFARHGQMQAEKMSQSKTQAEELNVEDLQWRIRHLRTARSKTEAQLADERLKLAHVEDHERRLQARLRELKIAVDELERAAAEKSDESQQGAAQLEAAKAELDAAQKALESARNQGKSKSLSYSVIPYHGKSGTSRRPIYIECRENLIILQPEGIELTPRDFVGFFGPGNPLASAVRAEREYFARQAPEGQLTEEPYPLLLVRPEGTTAYYAARAALDSWGTDFGYELVGSDWTFKFPEPDPQLARLLKQVVAEARLRHREYILTSPQVAKSRARPVYRAKAHGGFAPEGGSHTPGGSGRGGWDDFGGQWAQGPGGTSGDDRYGSADDGDGSTGNRGSASPGGKAALEDPYADAGGDRSGDDAAGGPGGEATGGHAQTHAAGEPPSAPGQYQASAGNPDGSSHAKTSDGAAGPAAESPLSIGQSNDDSPPSGSAMGSPASPHMPTQAMKKPKCMATTRGKNWGLPESSVHAVAATRPILVDCYSDRLVLVPESRGAVPKEIRLPARTEEAMDEFVSAVWDHMKGWGKAGKGLYWRPTLSMAVNPGAADRYADIKALLAESGLDVHERQSPSQPRQATRQSIRN